MDAVPPGTIEYKQKYSAKWIEVIPRGTAVFSVSMAVALSLSLSRSFLLF